MGHIGPFNGNSTSRDRAAFKTSHPTRGLAFGQVVFVWVVKMGPGPPSYLDKTALDHVGGAQLAPQVAGGKRRTTATRANLVPTVSPWRDRGVANGRGIYGKQLPPGLGSRPNRWPGLRP